MTKGWSMCRGQSSLRWSYQSQGWDQGVLVQLRTNLQLPQSAWTTWTVSPCLISNAAAICSTGPLLGGVMVSLVRSCYELLSTTPASMHKKKKKEKNQCSQGPNARQWVLVGFALLMVGSCPANSDLLLEAVGWGEEHCKDWDKAKAHTWQPSMNSKLRLAGWWQSNWEWAADED